MAPKMSSKKRRVALALCCCLSSASAFVPAPTTTITASRRRPRSGSVAEIETDLHVSTSYLFGTGTGTGTGTSATTTNGQPYLPQVNHRHSAKDWIHNVASLPHSSILRDIRDPVLAVVSWSTLVSVVHRLLMTSTNPVWGGLGGQMQVGATAHSFLVSSLGLLLVFRTNSAYQRFAVSTNMLGQIQQIRCPSIHPHWRQKIHFCFGYDLQIQQIRFSSQSFWLNSCHRTQYYPLYRRDDESGSEYCPRAEIYRG